MPTPAESDVTRILTALERGDPQASEQLLPAVYAELRRVAENRLRNEPPGLTLQATALVHEAYLRLLGGDDQWENAGHFFAAAAEAMRRILVERARRYGRYKHGGGRKRVDFDKVDPPVESKEAQDLLALDEALGRLEAENPIRAEVVKLRYFAGLTIEQAAEALGVSPVTVTRHWTIARAWLYSEVEGDLPADSENS